MTVIQKGEKGKWYYRFQINGKEYYRACKGATNKRQALDYENIVKADIMRGILKTAENKKKYTLKEAISVYLDYSKTNKASYINDKGYCDMFLEEWGGLDLEDITPEKIEKLKQKLQDLGRAHATINRVMCGLSKIFSLAIDNGYIENNPLRKVKKLRIKNYKIRFLTKEEEKRLFKAIKKINPAFGNIVLCALHTGMRKSEILNLKWDNIDFKDNYIEILDTKNNKARKVPISDKLLKCLNSIEKENDYVFFNPQTKLPWTDFRKTFDSVLGAAEINNFTFHDFRHTTATRMVEKGVDLLIVKEILGHSNITTTMRYAHPVPELKLRAIKLINNY